MTGISPDRLKRTQAQTATKKPSPGSSSSGADVLQVCNQPIQDELALTELGSPGHPVLSRQSLTTTATCPERVMLFLVCLLGQDAGRPSHPELEHVWMRLSMM